jgi:hypothetical protein
LLATPAPLAANKKISKMKEAVQEPPPAGIARSASNRDVDHRQRKGLRRFLRQVVANGDGAVLISSSPDATVAIEALRMIARVYCGSLSTVSAELVDWVDVRFCPKAPNLGPGQEHCVRPDPRDSSSQTEARIMRYKFANYEWTALGVAPNADAILTSRWSEQ